MSHSLRYSRSSLDVPGIESTLLVPGVSQGAVALDSQILIQQCQRQPDSASTFGTGKRASVEELCLRGFYYFDQKDFERSAEIFTELVKFIPASEIYFYLGVSYWEIDELDRAAAALEKAVRVRPENAPAQFVLASVYITPFLKSGDTSKLRKALKPAKMAIRLGHHVPMDYHYLGIVYEGLGNWSAAEENYRKAIEHDSSLAVAYIKLAYLYRQLAEKNPEEREAYYSEAIETYKRLLKVDPQNSDAYRYMASIYEDLGQVGEAIEACEKAVETDGDSLYALAGLSTLYLDAGRYDDAKSVLSRLIRMDPKRIAAYMKRLEDDDQVNVFRADAYTDYGVACMEIYRTQEEDHRTELEETDLLTDAERSFKKALELEPGTTNAMYDLAVLYYRQNRLDEAAERIQQLMEVARGNQSIEGHVRALLEEQIQERLLERGLLKEIKEPATDLTPYQNRTLMTVRNKSLSETVIEGRR